MVPLQVRFECADALLNSHVALGAACGTLHPRQEQSAAEQAAAALLQRQCLQLLHRACVAVPQIGPVGIACQAAEASRLLLPTLVLAALNSIAHAAEAACT